MKDELSFRRYDDGDDRDLSQKMQKVWGVEVDEGYFEWKYRRNPAGEQLSIVAEKNGRVVGQVGAIPVRFSFHGKELIGSQEVDIFLDEEHRRFNVFYNMTRCRHDLNEEYGVALSFGFTVESTSKIAQKVLNYNRICPIPRLFKILDVGPLVRDRLPAGSILQVFSSPVNGILRLRYSLQEGIPKGSRIATVDRFDERFDSFWNLIKGDYPIMVVRDSRYLNWRYVDIPHRRYEILSLEKSDSGEILGFVVLGKRHKGDLFGGILDIVSPRVGHERATRTLIQQAVDWFYEEAVSVVSCWTLPHCHIYPELVRCGFRRREKKGTDLVFRKNNLKDSTLSLESAKNEQDWYVSLGDSDFY